MQVVDFGDDVIIILYRILFFILTKLAIVLNQIVDEIPFRICKELFDVCGNHDSEVPVRVQESFKCAIVIILRFKQFLFF
jgi:hypothetical protein